MREQDFNRGVELLFESTQNAQELRKQRVIARDGKTHLERSTNLMFAEAGGRNRIIACRDFIEYFTTPRDCAVESSVPDYVTFFAMHKAAICRSLSQNDAKEGSVSWPTFCKELERGFGLGAEAARSCQQFSMDVLKHICDPRELGTVDYKVITNRCRFRMLNLRNSFLAIVWNESLFFSREMYIY